MILFSKCSYIILNYFYDYIILYIISYNPGKIYSSMFIKYIVHNLFIYSVCVSVYRDDEDANKTQSSVDSDFAATNKGIKLNSVSIYDCILIVF